MFPSQKRLNFIFYYSMKHSIQNDILQLSVNQSGAELCSIRSVITGEEYMWEADPAIWGSTSPVLFPIIGCLKEDSYVYDGKHYILPRHGFIRGNENIVLENKTPGSLTFSLGYSEETLRIYPFRFKFTIHYILENYKIRVFSRVENIGDEEMFFSLGGHPAFKCPVLERKKYNDYFLEFEKDETAFCYGPLKDGLIGPESRPAIEEGKIIYLNNHTFDKGALVFKKLSSSNISLLNNCRGTKIRVNFDGFPYLGIWSKPKARFVCIEPWFGIADSWNSDQKLETKEGILTLEGGVSFETEYSIEIIS
jgi:galactose mutarotase-like enzyme